MAVWGDAPADNSHIKCDQVCENRLTEVRLSHIVLLITGEDAMSPQTHKPADAKEAFEAALRDLRAGYEAQLKLVREAH